MSAALFWILHTAVMLLSLLIPGQITMWLVLSVILVSAAYLLGVWYPFLFSRAAQFWGGYKLLFLPVLLFIAAAVWIEQKTAVLWSLYVGASIVGWLVPWMRYFLFRLQLYKALRGKCSLYDLLFGGRKTPFSITLETTDGSVTVGILGTPGTTRYRFTEEEVISQPIRALSASVLGEVEDSASRMGCNGEMLLLSGKQSFAAAAPPTTEDAYLLVHPHCFVWNEAGTVQPGDRVGGYSLASKKTVLSVIRRAK